MDGPFEVRLFADGSGVWEGEFVEDRSSDAVVRHKLEIEREPFLASLIDCSNQLLGECSANGWESSDVEALSVRLEHLSRALHRGF